jgi:thiamine biosynthesis lipoprotein
VEVIVGFHRVEHHMSTAVTLAAESLDAAVADRFFARIAELEELLSRFLPTSQISRLAAGELYEDDLAPEVREVLDRCDAMRQVSGGDFEHEPAPGVLDVNALAKGWIIEEAATILRLATDRPYFVNAGGDVVTQGGPWRVGVRHPGGAGAVLGVLEVTGAAVATSATYERGQHLRVRRGPSSPASVTVVGPHLAEVDALSTAAFVAGDRVPVWWDAVSEDHGLLTMTSEGRVRWVPPRDATGIRWTFPDGEAHPNAGR